MRAVLPAVLCLLTLPVLASGQPVEPEERPAKKESVTIRGFTFIAGGAVGLAAHESGHLLFDVLFDAKLGVRKVSFGPIPFFAITHDAVSRRREFVISSAGFWVQEGLNEFLLSRRPRLRAERAPVAKGVFTFNVLASVAYAGAAFARAGPSERDTRTMAATLGISERWVGVIILAPAVLDAYRYFRPHAAWAAWGSRGIKVGTVLLVIK